MTYDLEDEKFVIDDDKKAEWALRVIKEDELERDRLISLAESQIDELKEQIEELKAKCDNKTAFLKSLLVQYMSTVKTKETKTQETYELLSGKLIMKKPKQKIIYKDDFAVMDWLENNDLKDFVPTYRKLDWAGFKKNLAIDDDGNVVNTLTGEIIDNSIIYTTTEPASFDVKLK